MSFKLAAIAMSVPADSCMPVGSCPCPRTCGHNYSGWWGEGFCHMRHGPWRRPPLLAANTPGRLSTCLKGQGQRHWAKGYFATFWPFYSKTCPGECLPHFGPSTSKVSSLGELIKKNATVRSQKNNNIPSSPDKSRTFKTSFLRSTVRLDMRLIKNVEKNF